MENIVTPIALVNFGRTHFIKLPQLGLIILNQKINESDKYSSEIFDYGEFPIYSIGGDHISVLHYIAQGNEFPVFFIPELNLIDLMLQYFKTKNKIKNHHSISMDEFKADRNRMTFYFKACKKLGHNPYLFMEMMERFCQILPRVTRELSSFQYIGFYNNASNFIGSILVSEILRYYFGKKTIFGGPQITASFPYAKKLAEKGMFFDFVVKGDADRDIVNILDVFCSNKSSNFDCSLDISHIAHGYKDDFDFDAVLNKGYKYSHLIFDTSRGCNFKCKFCGEFKIHGQISIRDPVHAADHILKLSKKYWRKKGFMWRIADSLINMDRKKLDIFLDRIIAHKHHALHPGIRWFSFYCYARGDIDRELAQKLKQAGCAQLWIGVESFQNSVLENVHKELSAQKIQDSMITCLQAGITIGLLLISPLDNIMQVESNYVYQEILAMKEFVKRVIKEVKLGSIKIGPIRMPQEVFIAAHTSLLIAINAEFHEKLKKDKAIINWKLDDFYNRDDNPYDFIPRSYQLSGTTVSGIIDYMHKDVILRKIFPLTKKSKLDRLDELLEFDSIGCMYRPLKVVDYNILQTPLKH